MPLNKQQQMLDIPSFYRYILYKIVLIIRMISKNLRGFLTQSKLILVNMPGRGSEFNLGLGILLKKGVPMKVFINREFSRFATKEDISDEDLEKARKKGPYYDLGGGVYKIRIARMKSGKSSGYRVILFKNPERIFFVYGFAKSDKENISKKELSLLKETATTDLSLSDAQINERLQEKTLREITCD
jgi:hypothetical protein